MNIILLNGAPKSGKDTLGKLLLETIPNAVHCSFKIPLYNEFAKRHGLEYSVVLDLCSTENKDLPSDLLQGRTPRSELIDISENHLKKNFGPDIVTHLVIDQILDTEEYGRKTFIFTDSGFEAERAALKRYLKHYGLLNLYTVRILRDGTSFENDSRTHLSQPDVTLVNDIEENGDQLGQNLLNQFNEWYNGIK